MKIYILGIAGTFMAGFAVIAKQMGMKVSGCDTGVYPPMSTQLQNDGITFDTGFNKKFSEEELPDLFIIGNAISRGNPMLEWILNSNLPFNNAPEFMRNHIFTNKHMIAIAGTHGKTTTTAMVAWILEYCNKNPSFLIGGIPNNFAYSARLTNSDVFVIEADEYDTAFFDKRSKFIHYRPNTLVINNIEFDHADIFANLTAIKHQFNNLIRTLPSQAVVIHDNRAVIKSLLQHEFYSKNFVFGNHKSSDLRILKRKVSANKQNMLLQTKSDSKKFDLQLPMLGKYNSLNAMAAISACMQVGITPQQAVEALQKFNGVQRRQEQFLPSSNIKFIEDFAHHPSAIKKTAQAFKQQLRGKGKLLLVVDPSSNTMKMGHHKKQLLQSLAVADLAIIYQHEKLSWHYDTLPKNMQSEKSVENIIKAIQQTANAGDTVLIMSNSSFGGLKAKLIAIYS